MDMGLGGNPMVMLVALCAVILLGFTALAAWLARKPLTPTDRYLSELEDDDLMERLRDIERRKSA